MNARAFGQPRNALYKGGIWVDVSSGMDVRSPTPYPYQTQSDSETDDDSDFDLSIDSRDDLLAMDPAEAICHLSSLAASQAYESEQSDNQDVLIRDMFTHQNLATINYAPGVREQISGIGIYMTGLYSVAEVIACLSTLLQSKINNK